MLGFLLRGKFQVEHSFKEITMTAEQVAALLAAVESLKTVAAQVIASNAALKAQLAAVPAPVDTTPLVPLAADLTNLAASLTAAL